MNKYLIAILTLNFLWACQKDCKDLWIPYEVQVPYTENVLADRKLTYSTGSILNDRKYGYKFENSLFEWEYRKPYWEASIMVTNTSSHNGYFGFSVTWESLGQELIGTSSAFIEAGASKLLEIRQETDHNSFLVNQTSIKKFEVIPSTVQVIESRTFHRIEKRYRYCNSCEKDCMPKRD